MTTVRIRLNTPAGECLAELKCMIALGPGTSNSFIPPWRTSVLEWIEAEGRNPALYVVPGLEPRIDIDISHGPCEHCGAAVFDNPGAYCSAKCQITVKGATGEDGWHDPIIPNCTLDHAKLKHDMCPRCCAVKPGVVAGEGI